MNPQLFLQDLEVKPTVLRAFPERISSALQSALMFREGPRRAADGCETGDWAHVDVYLARTLRYGAVFLPGSRYDEQALDWLRQRGSTVVAVGGAVPGAALAVRFRHDGLPGVRLMTETLVSELIAASQWADAGRRTPQSSPASSAVGMRPRTTAAACSAWIRR
ncbi:hypothetical protein ACIA5C_17020 [Actinoplanes sp. NPDC051343]|uniref:hypothetical protein n=1 Tax=Actinoplanes sp. NPDC051343 TaxID=3363906 RepID=UPI00378D8069